MKHINAQPGVRYREILRLLSSLSNDVLTYHIANLEKFGRISADRSINNKITRYYRHNIPTEETDVIEHIDVIQKLSRTSKQIAVRLV